MSDIYQSLSHTKWDCKYHVIFVPKRRRKVLYGNIRKAVGPLFHELARQKECVILEGHVMPDHIKKNSGEDAGFAQQPLEALMRRCLPAGERPALIGVDARRFDANQKLPGPGATAELCDRLGRAQGRVVLGQADVKLLRQCRAAGTAGDMPDVPAEHLGE